MNCHVNLVRFWIFLELGPSKLLYFNIRDTKLLNPNIHFVMEEEPINLVRCKIAKDEKLILDNWLWYQRG